MKAISFVLLSVLSGTLAQISCPSCSDGYDPTSCTGSVTCHNSHDVCELHVHTADRNRVEYVCHNSHACTNHEQHACDPNNHETCAFCCNSLDACKQQREYLFSTKYSTIPATMTTTTATTTANNSSMTNTTNNANVTTTMSSGAMCVQCGDKATDQDCDPLDLLNAQLSQCPVGQSYCVSEVKQNDTSVHIMKFCAGDAYCKTLWWDSTKNKPECQQIDISATTNSKDCTFCCQGDGCNTVLKPADNTLVTY